MAESLLVRKAGGGAKIEEALKSFTVAPGQTITAGTFVDSVNQEINFSSSTLQQLGINLNEMLRKVVALTPTKVLVAYFNDTTSTWVARVFTISNNTVTAHTVFNLGFNTGLALTVLNETKAVIVYCDNNNNGYLAARVLSINETTVTGWTPIALTNYNVGSSSVNLSASLMSKNPFKIAVAFIKTSNLWCYYKTFLVYENSINFITSDIPISSPGAESSYVSVLGLTPDNSIVTYRGYNNYQYMYNIAGGAINISTGLLYNLKLHYLKDNMFLLTFTNSSSQGVARSYYISSTNVITQGAEFYYTSITTSYPEIVKLDTKNENTGNAETNFLLVYRTTEAENNYTRARVLNVKHYAPYTITTPYNSVDFQSPSSDIIQIGAAALSNSKVLVMLQSSTLQGLSTILEKPLAVANTTAEKVFGLAKTNGTAGQTIDVYVNE